MRSFALLWQGTLAEGDEGLVQLTSMEFYLVWWNKYHLLYFRKEATLMRRSSVLNLSLRLAFSGCNNTLLHHIKRSWQTILGFKVLNTEKRSWQTRQGVYISNKVKCSGRQPVIVKRSWQTKHLIYKSKAFLTDKSVHSSCIVERSWQTYPGIYRVYQTLYRWL